MKNTAALFYYEIFVKKPVFTLGLVLLSISCLHAQETSISAHCSSNAEHTKFAAQLSSMEGLVQWKTITSEQWQDAKVGDRFCYGDTLKVVQYRATLNLANDTFVRLNEGALVKFIPPEKIFWLELLEGLAYFFSRTPNQFTVKTPYMNASIDGTEFLVSATAEEYSVSVFEGAVNTSIRQGSVLVKKGEKVIIKTTEAPHLMTTVRLQDAADWTFYYPPLFENKHLPENLASALAQGDYATALTIIDESANASTSPDLLATKAAIELFYGQVKLSEKNINKVLMIDGKHPLASSLQVLLTLVKGNSDQALKDALTLNQQFPNNAVVKLTLSYAQQAVFQLQSAFSSAREATEIAGNESLAWARVAEIALSLGKTGKALEAAKESLALNPSLSRAHSINGFVALQRYQTSKAQTHFTQAIKLDPADPLPRFALGLTNIRRGKLEQGRKNIELAVVLNPGNSLFRSYLGKAYFEENRHGVANGQFDLAKQLDPDDPTPWFYQAILLQSQNQPYQALQSIAESIELNDNRAVYRSRLLLDADEAARQTSQADIYLDLSFDELAKRSAAKSLVMAPDEHGGHRLLAESLVNDQRADIARTSEVLQAQLLQPLTATPIRSVLGEGDLLVLDGTGPGKMGTNEFNSAFNRNDLRLQTYGVSGSNRTEATDTVVSGLVGPISFALGDYNYHTDGYRENNDLEYDISTVFVQGQLFDWLNIMVEGRSRKEERGDLAQQFLEAVFSETERLISEKDNVRMGFNYLLNQKVTVLGVFDYIENNLANSSETLLFVDVIRNLQFEYKERASASELQFILKEGIFNGVSGFKTDNIDRKELESEEITVSPDPPVSRKFPPREGELKYENAYSYWNIIPNHVVNLFVGLSYVKFDDEVTLKEELSQWNPKLGIQIQAMENLSIRLAGFRNLKGPFIIDQTLEPTQIVGLNQLHDDVDGTDSQNVAFAIDHQLNKGTALGVELLDRELEFPVAGAPGHKELSDNLYSAYFYWALQDLAISINYIEERQKFETNESFVNRPVKLQTKRLPLNINYNNRNGFSFSIEPSYINQSVYFKPIFSESTVTEKDQFWILNLAAKYWFWQKKGAIVFEVKNAGKKNFQFQSASLLDAKPTPVIYSPERTFLGRISVSL